MRGLYPRYSRAFPAGRMWIWTLSWQVPVPRPLGCLEMWCCTAHGSVLLFVSATSTSASPLCQPPRTWCSLNSLPPLVPTPRPWVPHNTQPWIARLCGGVGSGYQMAVVFFHGAFRDGFDYFCTGVSLLEQQALTLALAGPRPQS